MENSCARRSNDTLVLNSHLRDSATGKIKTFEKI